MLVHCILTAQVYQIKVHKFERVLCKGLPDGGGCRGMHAVLHNK